MMWLLMVAAGPALADPPAPAIVTPVARECPASSKVTIIAAYGDSTTQGVGAANASEAMPAVLQSLVCNSKVSNEGVSGTRADQLLRGTDGKHKSWAEELKHTKASIILLNFGINDSRQPGETVQSYSMNMDLLVRAAKAAGKQVILETPNPIFPTMKADAPDPKLQAHAEVVRKIARAEHVPFIDVNATMLSLVKRRPLNELYSDALHPTAAGYQAIAEAAAKVIETKQVTP